METPNLDLTANFEEDENSIEGLFLTFTLKNQVYGIEIQYVREIVDIQKITRVPGVADYIKGLINLRGQVIPVLDVRLRFGVESRKYDSRTCIIVVEVDETMVGLIVDRVADVLIISEDKIQIPPSAGLTVSERFIKGLGKVGKDVKFLLDIEKLIVDVEGAMA
ncbi:MAG: purine-binding chemotaxis protein CheW [SAR324 cluster bacterium]|nr:purine-binding chemotaxis protein CheW [SAR324 cluster bacterium]